MDWIGLDFVKYKSSPQFLKKVVAHVNRFNMEMEELGQETMQKDARVAIKRRLNFEHMFAVSCEL